MACDAIYLFKIQDYLQIKTDVRMNLQILQNKIEIDEKNKTIVLTHLAI